MLSVDLQDPPHILTVCSVDDRRNKLIAKKVHSGSKEIEILKNLGSSAHIIRMLDSFSTPSASWLVLPILLSVAKCLLMKQLELADNIGQVCSGLINGLAYLHNHCVAHRDNKPDNLVVDRYFCTKIIDFDSAIQLADEDEEVDGECGTEHWMAPEIEKAPLTYYSLIKADRWSCGHVILYLFEQVGREDIDLRSFALRLKVDDPQQRPRLLDWRASQTPPSHTAPQVRHHAIGFSEFTEERNAKRQRFEPVVGATQFEVHWQFYK